MSNPYLAWAVAELGRLGYFSDDSNPLSFDEIQSMDIESPEAKSALERWQSIHGVDEEGFGPKTASLMLTPRCGRPDIMPARDTLCKWDRLEISAFSRLAGLDNDFDPDKVFREAYSKWNKVCGIEISRASYADDAQIASYPGSMDGNVLAWSYLPCERDDSNTKIRQEYNRAKDWNYVLFLEVAMHELGHALGLDHGPKGSVMHAYAIGKYTELQEWDVEQGVLRYGPPTTNPEPPLPPTGGGRVVGTLTMGDSVYDVVARSGDGGTTPGSGGMI